MTELEVIGRRLYSYGWQTAMAKALKVDARTVRRWHSTKTPYMVFLALEALEARRGMLG